MSSTVQVRPERPEDIPAIREVNDRAFGRAEEGALVDALRSGCDGVISLVAVAEDRVVGHVLFSPATICAADGSAVAGMGLGPVAVLPEWQGQGIGGELIVAGLAAAWAASCPFVIVLGHTTYYPRFAFEPASRHGIRCKWDVPDDAFMILVPDWAAMRGATGLASYRPEFDAAT
jgi:putative acetyltransferase